MIVADTNLISYLFLTGPHSEQAEYVLEQEPDWIAPVLWRSEFRNVLALYMRKNIISLERSIEIVDAAHELMDGREFDVASHQVLQLAEKSGCSAYDCEFVALAQQMEVSLVTSDKKLRRAFPELCIAPKDF